MKQLPNFFTLLNLVFGCVAIIYIFKDGDSLLFSNKPGDFSFGLMIGGVYIFLAAVVDFLDGFIARLMHASSEMGAQLDSLCDAVTFGVAPGMIMYRLLELALSRNGMAPDNIGYLLPALLIPCCAVWRLAKFNLDKEQTYYFKGVPSPAAGLTIASLPFIVGGDNSFWEGVVLNPYVLYGITVVVSLLMVVNLPLISLKFKNFSVKSNIEKFILLLIGIVVIIFLRWAAVPVIFVSYVLVSLIFKPGKI